MYTFTLLDAFFFTIIMIILVLMAFSFGYTCKMERLTEALKNETVWANLLKARLDDALMDLARSQRERMLEKVRQETNALSMLVNQQKTLKKLHREALRKYKARCDAKLTKQVDTLKQTKLSAAWVGVAETA